MDNLKLSERMIQMLLNFNSRPQCPCYDYGYFVVTVKALERRGLVIYLNPGFGLTDAGLAVVTNILDSGGDN